MKNALKVTFNQMGVYTKLFTGSLLNNVQIISIVETGKFSYVPFYKDLTSSYNNSYSELGMNKNVYYPKNEKEPIYIEGDECSLQSKNCRLYIQGFYLGDSFSYESIPNSFKVNLDMKKTYNLGRFRFYETSNSKDLNNLENIKSMFFNLENYDDKVLLLYIPSALNNGVPVILNKEGQEHYFVKK